VPTRTLFLWRDVTVDQAQIIELARAIANQSLADAWPYWLAVLSLGILISVGGAFVVSYATKHAEVKQAKADRAEILAGLRATTKATEEVKSVISLGEWNERERRTVRRNKLEELLLLAHKVREWQIAELERVADPNLPERPHPQTTMVILGKLYFPELRNEVKAFDHFSDLYSLYLGSLRMQSLQAQANASGLAAQAATSNIISSASSTVLQHQRDTYKALLDLETAAEKLMEQIITP
jgi:hypothetical protein